MRADPFHKDISPDIFFAQSTETLVFEDERGPILFVNLAAVYRAFVQFPPDDPTRVREALPIAFNFVRGRARVTGVKEIIFESVARPLIRFCKQKLGFRASPNEYKTAV